MQVQVDIEFDELLKIVKSLPEAKLSMLKTEIDKDIKKPYDKDAFEKLLLNGPVATKKQLETIKKNRQAINKWRTK